MLYFAYRDLAASGTGLADLAGAAGSVIEAAGDLISVLGPLISFLAGIIIFFTGKSKEQKQAEKRKKKAKEKREKARKAVEDRLAIKDLALTLPNQDEVEVSWKPLGESVKYTVTLVRTDVGGGHTCLIDKTTENHKVSVKSDKVKFDSKLFLATVHASISAKGQDFNGAAQVISKGVIPLLPPPSKLEVESKRDGREIHVRFSAVEFAKEYKVEVVNHSHALTTETAIVKLGPKDKEGTHVFYAEKLKLEAPGDYQIGVCALEQDKGPQEFKYSNEHLYLVAAPSDVDFTYEPTLQQLSAKWKVSSTQKISHYLCEIQSVETNDVVFSNDLTEPKDGSLESALQIKLSRISDKAKSPYRLRVCSLGEQGTLASVFVSSKDQLSFLPPVQGISTSYDPQSNQLTVDWSPVTGATKFEVTITDKTGSSSVARKVISGGKINNTVFSMDQVQLKCGEKYAVSLIAEGSDALHLPSVPSTASTEFALLPKPPSISQEYYFDKKELKVTFQPVPDAEAHLIEIFSETTPKEIECRHVVPKPAQDWPSTINYSFDVATLKSADGGPFKSKVTAQGNAKWINSLPCVSPTEINRSKAPTSVALKSNAKARQLDIIVSSTPGEFTATIEDTAHKSRQVNKQSFVVKQDNTETQSVHQTLLTVPINVVEETEGAVYQAAVVNNGDQKCLPSVVKKSNEVALLDPPGSVTQEFQNDVFTVAWKCVKSAAGYDIKVYNTKTKSTAIEKKITSGLRPVGDEMKEEFDRNTLVLQSGGLYQTLITVIGDEYSIGGKSAISKTTIPSYSSPKDVSITFNNITRQMHVHCTPVIGDVAVELGVIDVDKLKTSDGNVEKALLTSMVLTSSKDEGKPFEVLFDESILSKSHDGSYKGAAQILNIQGQPSLPSGFSISHDQVTWLKAPKVNLSYVPQTSSMEISWCAVNPAILYLVEILQTREDVKGKDSTLIPFSQVMSQDADSCYVKIKDIDIKENDKFKAKVQPQHAPGSLIRTDESIGYSNITLVCESSPFNVDVLKAGDETVLVSWERLSPLVFEFDVLKISGGIEKQVKTEVCIIN